MEFETPHNFKEEKRRKDKADTATVDKVLDPKTIDILNKLSKRGKLMDLCGSFSCGKEANVYVGKCSTSLSSKFIQRAADSEETVISVVLKIYKTSAMLFKDRTRYIVDEKRFKRFCKSNSRKLIKLWSEKEVRNLNRLGKHGILCPKPLYLKRNILIMSMIGDNEPSPRLKDANLGSVEEWTTVYGKCIQLIKDMYQKARLVHADFSEYNVIYHREEVYVIDVSQSMSIGQENSNTFLVMDLLNCNEFFEKKGVKIRGEVGLFEEITQLKVPEYLSLNGRLIKDCFIPSRIIEVANKEDLKLFISDYKETGLDMKYFDDSGAIEDCEISSGEDCDNCTEDYEDCTIEDSDISNDEDKSTICDIKNLGENLQANLNLNIDDDDSSVDVESNELSNILDEPNEDVPAVNHQIAKFDLKTYSDLTLKSINIYVRRLRLKNPLISKEEEKAFNKERKSLVKQMNKERRAMRAKRKVEFKRKNKNQKNKYFKR